MLKTLQTNEGRDGAVDGIVRPNELVIDSAYCERAIQLIKSAASEIRLCAYAWKWYDTEPEIGIQQLNVALIHAMKRGVIVKCLVDSEALQTRLRDLGFNARSVHPSRMMHSKVISANHDALIIGSHNLTKRANTVNYEVSIVSYDFEICSQFNNYFDKMWDSRG